MENQFDQTVRERLAGATVEPDARLWERIEKRMDRKRVWMPVWAKLAAGLLVAGAAASWFLVQEKPASEMAAGVIRQAAPEPLKPEPTKPKTAETEKPLTSSKQVVTNDLQTSRAEVPADDPLVALDEKMIQEEVAEPAQETVQVAAPAGEELTPMFAGTLVYELDLSAIPAEPVATRRGSRSLRRLTGLLREVKAGEVSFGQVREFKDGLFTRAFWKEKTIRENDNKIQ